LWKLRTLASERRVKSEPSEGFSQWLSFRSNRLMLTGNGRLGAIISVIQAKKHSHAIRGAGGCVWDRDQACSSETEPGRPEGAHGFLLRTCVLASTPFEGKLFQEMGSFSFTHRT